MLEFVNILSNPSETFDFLARLFREASALRYASQFAKFIRLDYEQLMIEYAPGRCAKSDH